ncbi:MAG TPA: transposase [Acidimicrobiales bacterium]|nr:transposase [Acidimicrobiales bacterium]
MVAGLGVPEPHPFLRQALTHRAGRDRILAAVELGLSNSKLEGLNSKIRLINHRGYGHHSAAAVIAMIYSAVAASRRSCPFGCVASNSRPREAEENPNFPDIRDGCPWSRDNIRRMVLRAAFLTGATIDIWQTPPWLERAAACAHQ